MQYWANYPNAYVAGANYGEAYMRNLPQDFVIPDFRMAERPELYLPWGDGVEVSSSVNPVYPQDGTSGTSSSAADVGAPSMESSTSPTDMQLAGRVWRGENFRKDYFPGPINRAAPIAHSGHPTSVHSPHTMYSPPPPATSLHQGEPRMLNQPGGITVTSNSNNLGSPGGSLVVPQPLKMQRPNKTYHCRMCDQIFDSKSDLLVHSQHVHKQDPKPYKCPTCNKCFANSSYLSQHARIHSGIKPYRCQICERKFTQLCHLQQHTRTHTGEKPYKCQHPGCGKAFTQLSNLQSHSRSHMTDKPYRCNSCYKCFADEMGLRQHIPKHSETKHLKTHICHICGKSYTQETYLTRHMAKHSFDNSNRSGLNKGLMPSSTSSQHLVPRHEPLDIKPQIDGNGIATSPDAVSSKPSSAFMPLPHQYGSTNMMNSSVASNFPFPPPRLPYSTLNSPLPHISSVSTTSRSFPFAEPVSFQKREPGIGDRMGVGAGREGNFIANSLLSLQQIKNFSSTHSSHLGPFSKSEPSSPVHKEFS